MCSRDQCQSIVVVYESAKVLNLTRIDSLKASDISCPNVYPAPRGLIPQPHLSSGSDHNKSHMGPSCGTSWILSIDLIWSSVSIDGDNPPCRQKILPSAHPSKRAKHPTHLVIDQSGKREVIKQVGKELPDIRIPVFPQTLVVESINLRNLSRFMVTSKDGDSISISEFKSNEQRNSLDGIISSINVISHEEVIGIRGISSNPEKL